MPTLTDTDITTWTADYQTLGASSLNSPHTADLILGLIAEQFQNVKSVFRAESENKQWERWGLTATWLSNPSANIARYSIPGNALTAAVPPGPIELNRAVLVITSGVTMVGYIGSIASTSPTVFRVHFSAAAPSSSPSEMMFGVTTPTNSGLHHHYQCGTTTMVAGAGAATVTFPFEEPDTNYFAFAQIKNYDNSSFINPSPQLYIPNRSTTQMQIAAFLTTIAVVFAPSQSFTGSVATERTPITHDATIDWMIIR